ncbi:MAG: hypothetical protein M1831_002094 [Alyxoria varia]|nr:MAG: hypothetical protein M1831_002094 [Alyxoria varia]
MKALIAVTILGILIAAASAATAKTSNVKGAAFDRIAIIWLENTDYDKAEGDPSLNDLAKKGIALTNYFAVTHPSEPNYVASHGGDHFGLECVHEVPQTQFEKHLLTKDASNDDFNSIPKNVNCVTDLLDTKGISWAAYQEHMPYSGFKGNEWKNQKTQANDYVRKHNPTIMFDVNNTPARLPQTKNFTLFYEDLKNDRLPQWMFITPNMTNNGHDTSVTTAGEWSKRFLTPLLNDENFMRNTLVLLTFDENDTYTSANRVFTILLGDAVPSEMEGTEDDTFYTHYSELSTVEANWGLPTLGRWDVGANVFDLVAEQTGDKLRPYKKVTANEPSVFLNASYAGPLIERAKNDQTYPPPNTKLVHNGRKVLPAVVDRWINQAGSSYYSDTVEIPDAQHPPKGL